jgi:hypothetical protein
VDVEQEIDPEQAELIDLFSSATSLKEAKYNISIARSDNPKVKSSSGTKKAIKALQSQITPSDILPMLQGLNAN